MLTDRYFMLEDTLLCLLLKTLVKSQDCRIVSGMLTTYGIPYETYHHYVYIILKCTKPWHFTNGSDVIVYRGLLGGFPV